MKNCILAVHSIKQNTATLDGGKQNYVPAVLVEVEGDKLKVRRVIGKSVVLTKEKKIKSFI